MNKQGDDQRDVVNLAELESSVCYTRTQFQIAMNHNFEEWLQVTVGNWISVSYQEKQSYA